MKTRSFFFVSTLYAAPWAGSEELWARAASNLAERGHTVDAAVQIWPVAPRQWTDLDSCGVRLVPRSSTFPWSKRLARRLLPSRLATTISTPIIATHARQCIAKNRYDLVVICEAAAWPPVQLLQAIEIMKVPFVFISQGNSEEYWPSETNAQEYGRILGRAAATYFVADENRALAESQIGYELPNARIVRNPIKFHAKTPLPWPNRNGTTFKMACVARLYPAQKGQDKLLRTLALPHWRDRDWKLSFAGEGPHEGALRRMVSLLGLGNRVEFLGQVSNIQELWRNNHLHVLPSRYEGMPLSILEASACGRPTLTTRVADNDRFVTDDRTGILAAASDVNSLDLALERAWTLRPTLQKMGLAAYASAITSQELVAEDELAISLEQVASD